MYVHGATLIKLECSQSNGRFPVVPGIRQKINVTLQAINFFSQASMFSLFLIFKELWLFGEIKKGNGTQMKCLCLQ